MLFAYVYVCAYVCTCVVCVCTCPYTQQYILCRLDIRIDINSQTKPDCCKCPNSDVESAKPGAAGAAPSGYRHACVHTHIYTYTHSHTKTDFCKCPNSDVEGAKPGAAGAAPSGYKLPAGVISASPQAKKLAKQNGLKIESIKVSAGPSHAVYIHAS